MSTGNGGCGVCVGLRKLGLWYSYIVSVNINLGYTGCLVKLQSFC